MWSISASKTISTWNNFIRQAPYLILLRILYVALKELASHCKKTSWAKCCSVLLERKHLLTVNYRICLNLKHLLNVVDTVTRTKNKSLYAKQFSNHVDTLIQNAATNQRRWKCGDLPSISNRIYYYSKWSSNR